MLRPLLDRAVASGCQDFSHIPGREGLALTVQRKVLPKYGFAGTSEGVRQMNQALALLTEIPNIRSKLDAMNRKLRAPKFKRTSSGDLSSGDGTLPGSKANRVLTKAQVIALQKELLAGYRASKFETELQELRVTVEQTEPRSQEYMRALTEKVRPVQAQVLPKYGLEATEEGVLEMITAVDMFYDHADVFALSAAIDEVLYGSAVCDSAQEERGRAGLNELPKDRFLHLLREMHIKFSSPEFQADITALKDASPGDDASGYLHLAGRNELTLAARKSIFRLYGLPSTSKGVDAFQAHCAKYRQDEDVVRLINAINTRLGMGPIARKNFVDQLDPVAQQNIDGNPNNCEGGENGAIGRLETRSSLSGLVSGPGPASAGASPDAARGAGRAVPTLTKPRAATMLSELFTGLRLKSCKKLLEDTPCHRATKLSARRIRSVLNDALLRYGFPENDEGLGMLWDAFQPFLSDPTVAAKLEAVQEEVRAVTQTAPKGVPALLAAEDPLPRGSPDVAQQGQPAVADGGVSADRTVAAELEAMQEETRAVTQTVLKGVAAIHAAEGPLPGGSPDIAQQGQPAAEDGGVSSHHKEIFFQDAPPWMMALHEDLLAGFSAPLLQKKLNDLQRRHDPSSAEFGKLVNVLVRSVQCNILPRYGFSASDAGTEALIMELQSMLPDRNLQVLQAAIDEALYGPSLTSKTGRLTKRGAKALMRDQLAEFTTEEFRKALEKLNHSKLGARARMDACAELALPVQRKLLPRYDFGCSRGDVARAITQCTEIVVDLEVNSLLRAIEYALGMSLSACAAIHSQEADHTGVAVEALMQWLFPHEQAKPRGSATHKNARRLQASSPRPQKNATLFVCANVARVLTF